jgi:hypothetical protein
MSQLARLGFVLLGLSLILEPLSMAGGFLSDLPRADFSVRGLVFTLGWWVAFGFVPGLVLCLGSRALAAWLFPQATREDELDSRSIITAGLVVVGAYLIVTGLSDTGGAAMALILTKDSLPQLAGNIASGAITGVLEALLGSLLVFKARPLTAFLFRRSDAAA